MQRMETDTEPGSEVPSPTRAARLADHPTVRALRSRGATPLPPVLTREALRAMALAAGADDAGVVSLDHPDLVDERTHVLKALPGARTLVSLVLKMHPDDVRSPRRSVANLEFHRAGQSVDGVAHRLAVAIGETGHRAINPSMAFPMEMEDFPGRAWVVSHKRVAQAAQLGRMGLHRSVIHPRFGSFILLGTVVTTAAITGENPPLTYDPCVDCKLCVAACPVGALEPDGTFHFSACNDHNYREFMTGFGDYMEAVADSKDRHALREKVSLSETASMWQSLAFRPNYKAAYCIAVCPAGEDILGPFLTDRAGHLRDVVKPLTQRVETVYAVAGSDAADYVRRRFPHKRVRLVRSSLRATTAVGFLRGLPLLFQPGQAAGLKATYHFDLTGPEVLQATVVIDHGTLAVTPGLVGDANVRVTAPAETWLDVVSGRRSAVRAVLTGGMRVRGDRGLLARFARCFPR